MAGAVAVQGGAVKPEAVDVDAVEPQQVFPREEGGEPVGRPIVSVRSNWGMIDRETRRLLRIPAEVAAPFVARPSGPD